MTARTLAIAVIVTLSASAAGAAAPGFRGGALEEMKPGGHHIMLLGLKRDLKPGDTVTVTVTFEKAGMMTVEAPVR
jgi:hypothetical protein